MLGQLVLAGYCLGQTFPELILEARETKEFSWNTSCFFDVIALLRQYLAEHCVYLCSCLYSLRCFITFLYRFCVFMPFSVLMIIYYSFEELKRSLIDYVVKSIHQYHAYQSVVLVKASPDGHSTIEGLFFFLLPGLWLLTPLVLQSWKVRAFHSPLDRLLRGCLLINGLKASPNSIFWEGWWAKCPLGHKSRHPATTLISFAVKRKPRWRKPCLLKLVLVRRTVALSV